MPVAHEDASAHEHEHVIRGGDGIAMFDEPISPEIAAVGLQLYGFSAALVVLGAGTICAAPFGLPRRGITLPTRLAGSRYSALLTSFIRGATASISS
jgi:hypothetical protein